MHPFRRPAFVLALLAALALQACGDSTADRLASIRTGLASSEPKQVAGAIVGLKSLIQKQPKLAEARLLLGQHQLRTGNPAAAAIELQRAADLGLPPATVLPALARALLFDGKAAQVVARFKSERLADPAAQAALLSTVAIAMAHQGDLDGANGLLAAVLQATPQATPALLAQARLQGMQGRFAEGLQLLEALRQRDPAQAELWTLRGELLGRQPGQNAAAQQALVEALRLEPQSTQAMLSLIPLRLAAGDLAGAKATFQQLKALAPDLVGTGIAEANIAYAGGEHHRARELFQALLKVLPDHIALLLSAGENELRLGSVQQAEAHFAKAVALAPNHALARRQLALAQLRLGQAAKALVTLEPLLDQPDAPVEVLALAADAQRANGQARAARQLYDRIARLNPTDARLRTAIALGSANAAEPDKVVGELRAIAASDKGDSADLALINLHIQRGQHDQALAALDALERKRPKDAAVHQLRGQVLAARNDNAAARASFERALQLQPNHVPAIAALAALDVRAKDLASARKRFDAVLKAQPGNAAALLGLAEVLRLDGAAPQRVTAQIEAAIQAAPQDPQARLQLIRHHLERNNTEAALNAARAATAALPENLDLLDLQARCHLRLQQSQQALSSYGKMAQAAPRSARPHVGMADVHLATNDLDAAERSIARALQLSPGLIEARAQAIALAMRRQQFDKAVDLARAVQKEQPESSLGYTLEGEVELRRGRWAAATNALQTAVTKPAPGAAPMKLYQALKQDKRDADAERFAARWMAAHPQDIPFQLVLADSAQGAGRIDRAEALYRQVLKTQPDHAGALNNLAMLLAAQKKPEAVELAERAVRAAPDSATVLDTLATAQASQGELGEAVATQRRAVALAPADPPLRLALARLLLQANKPALAKPELIKVMESAGHPTDLEEAKRLLASLP